MARIVLIMLLADFAIFSEETFEKQKQRSAFYLTEEIRDQNLVTGNCTQDLG